jgi:predicted DNA binding CopG/RHH family protein
MSKVPTFASEAEEAAFWDTHDVTEFLEDLPRESVTARRGMVISVRVYQEDFDLLKRLAATQSIGYTTYARMLIHRGLQTAMARRRAQEKARQRRRLPARVTKSAKLRDVR